MAPPSWRQLFAPLAKPAPLGEQCRRSRRQSQASWCARLLTPCLAHVPSGLPLVRRAPARRPTTLHSCWIRSVLRVALNVRGRRSAARQPSRLRLMPSGLPMICLLKMFLLTVSQLAEARVLGEILPQRPLWRHQVLQLALIRLRSQQDCL